MSTLAYGALTRKRKQAPRGKSKGAADDPKNDWPPALKPWVDTLTALVPAEALVAHAYVMNGYRDGILGASWIQIAFWVLPIVCVVAYFIGERRTHGFEGTLGLGGLNGWDVIRGFVVPLGAYYGWMLAQNRSILDLYCPVSVVCPVTETKRYLVVPLMALILGYIAGWPGADKADKQEGLPALEARARKVNQESTSP
jgi:hypothetical protein